MTIAIVVGICVLLLILGFLAPFLSRRPERATHKAFRAGGDVAGSAPGPLGRWLRKPFDSSSKAARRSATAGRRGRSKLPF